MLTQAEHIRSEMRLLKRPPSWRVILSARSVKFELLVGEYSYLRTARRGLKRARPGWLTGSMRIEVENTGPGPYWIPWEDEDGKRIEWPPAL